MDKNIKNKLIIAGIVCVILVLAFELFVYNKRNDVDEEDIKLQQQINELKSTNVYSEKEEIYTIVNEIVDLMNKKEYEKLYSMLKDDYKQYYFDEYEKFETYIQKYAAIEYVPKYTSYYREGNKYIVVTEFLQREYTRDNLVNGVMNKYDIITIEKGKNGAYKFALSNFIESTQNNKTKGNDKLEVAIMRTTRYAEKTEVKLLITNKSDKNIYIDNKNINLNVAGGNVSVLSSLSKTAIKPAASLVVNVEFYMKYDSYKEFNGCTISGIENEDGKVYEDITVEI